MKKIDFQKLYKKFLKLEAKQKKNLYIVLFFVVLLVVDRGIIYPIGSAIKRLNEDIMQRKEKIKKDLGVYDQKDRVNEAVSKYEDFLSGTRPKDEEITFLLKDIEILANKSRVYIVDLKPSISKEEGSVIKYFVNLNCEATMGTIIEFLYLLDNINKMFFVEKFRISLKSKDSDLLVCSLVISKVVIP